MTTTPPEPPSDGDAERGPVPPGPDAPDGSVPPPTPATPETPAGDVPPPPPDPGYGQTPPPPPDPGYGYGQAVPPPPGYGQPAYGAPGSGAAAAYGEQPPGVGDAFSYGWAKFSQNVGVILTAMLIYIVAFAVVGGILYVTVIAAAGNSGGYPGALFLIAVETVIFALLGYLIQAGFIRGALSIAQGVKPDLGTFLSTENFGQVVIASLIIAVASGIGSFLCYLPGLIIQYLLQFTLFFIIDRKVGAIDALKASFDFTTKNFGILVLFSILAVVILVAAAIFCLLPLLVAFPVVLIAQTFLYLRLQGRPVVTDPH